MGETRKAYRTCPLCEATCGLEITVNGGIQKVRGDDADVFSHGFLCPKGVALKELHEDPDRLRSRKRRLSDPSFDECSWDEAFSLVEAGLGRVAREHGRNAVGVYMGNPNPHNLSALLYARP